MVLRTEILQIDRYPLLTLMETEKPVDCTNGRPMAFPGGLMVIVGHINHETFASWSYYRQIHVVRAASYHPVQDPEEGDDAVIGYYSGPRGRVDVRRNPKVHLDWKFENYEGPPER